MQMCVVHFMEIIYTSIFSFGQITIPTRLSHVVGPYSYWNMQFYQGEGAYVNWELSVGKKHF